jgi:hypothetical protein
LGARRESRTLEELRAALATEPAAATGGLDAAAIDA